MPAARPAALGVLDNGIDLIWINNWHQRVTLGALLIGAMAVAQWRQPRAEQARTRIAAAA